MIVEIYLAINERWTALIFAPVPCSSESFKRNFQNRLWWSPAAPSRLLNTPMNSSLEMTMRGPMLINGDMYTCFPFVRMAAKINLSKRVHRVRSLCVEFRRFAFFSLFFPFCSSLFLFPSSLHWMERRYCRLQRYSVEVKCRPLPYRAIPSCQPVCRTWLQSRTPRTTFPSGKQTATAYANMCVRQTTERCWPKGDSWDISARSEVAWQQIKRDKLVQSFPQRSGGRAEKPGMP